MPIVEEALKSCDLPDKLPVIVHQDCRHFRNYLFSQFGLSDISIVSYCKVK